MSDDFGKQLKSYKKLTRNIQNQTRKVRRQISAAQSLQRHQALVQRNQDLVNRRREARLASQGSRGGGGGGGGEKGYIKAQLQMNMAQLETQLAQNWQDTVLKIQDYQHAYPLRMQELASNAAAQGAYESAGRFRDQTELGYQTKIGVEDAIREFERSRLEAAYQAMQMQMEADHALKQLSGPEDLPSAGGGGSSGGSRRGSAGGGGSYSSPDSTSGSSSKYAPSLTMSELRKGAQSGYINKDDFINAWTAKGGDPAQAAQAYDIETMGGTKGSGSGADAKSYYSNQYKKYNLEMPADQAKLAATNDVIKKFGVAGYDSLTFSQSFGVKADLSVDRAVKTTLKWRQAQRLTKDYINSRKVANDYMAATGGLGNAKGFGEFLKQAFMKAKGVTPQVAEATIRKYAALNAIAYTDALGRWSKSPEHPDGVNPYTSQPYKKSTKKRVTGPFDNEQNNRRYAAYKERMKKAGRKARSPQSWYRTTHPATKPAAKTTAPSKTPAKKPLPAGRSFRGEKNQRDYTAYREREKKAGRTPLGAKKWYDKYRRK